MSTTTPLGTKASALPHLLVPFQIEKVGETTELRDNIRDYLHTALSQSAGYKTLSPRGVDYFLERRDPMLLRPRQAPPICPSTTIILSKL